MPAGISTSELVLPLAEGQAAALMHSLMEGDLAKQGTAITVDGLRIEYEDGWGLVRASNTTPSLVFRFEATNKQGLARIQEDFRRALHKVSPDLKLPF